MSSYKDFPVVAMAIDPIHVGTGGARLGRVDLTIVRDPVTRVPKIPGSSLAGVYRSYVAMHFEEQNPGRQVQGQPKPYFPDCAGLGQPNSSGQGGHCGQASCPVCVTFGFARGQGGGLAGLAAFSDAHVLLFPVPTCEGPVWVTSPEQLRIAGVEESKLSGITGNFLYHSVEKEQKNTQSSHEPSQQNTQAINLGWLWLKRKPETNCQCVKEKLECFGIPKYITDSFGILPDKLFSHVVNSNLEVRTSVSINPATGAAEEGALFSYEALPRTTILVWTITCRNPQHFKISGSAINAMINGNQIDSPDRVKDVAVQAHPFLEHLGIGGMGSRGMGRLRVLEKTDQVNQPRKEGAQ